MARPLDVLALTALAAAALAACDNGGAAPAAPAERRVDAASAEDPPKPAEKGAPVYGYRVVASYPHDPRAFTQGLVFADGRLFESTGHYGASSVREVDLETGRILRQRRLQPNFFGEGLIYRDGQLVQLTWHEGTALVWDATDLRPLFTHRYTGEGWGLAYDGTRLILSDGKPRLRFLHPDSFAPLGEIEVKDGERPVENLNELEWIDGELYANVWHSDRIARIDVATGKVTSWIDLTGIIDLKPDPPIGERQNVLNGIAWDAEGKRLFVTGKNWPKLFHIEVVPPE